MILTKVLEHLGYTTNTDFEIYDDLDGNGQYIKYWHHVDPQPDQATLDAAWVAVQAAEVAAVIPTAKVVAKSEIDRITGIIRSKYITLIFGQDDIYREKSDQAIEYAAAGYPSDASSYPFIQAESNATGQTPMQAADSIISARQSWMAIMASIEEERRRGKVNIDLAIDISEVEIARDNALTALQLL